jgi:hypothetical protein
MGAGRRLLEDTPGCPTKGPDAEGSEACAAANLRRGLRRRTVRPARGRSERPRSQAGRRIEPRRRGPDGQPIARTARTRAEVRSRSVRDDPLDRFTATAWRWVAWIAGVLLLGGALDLLGAI